MVQNLACHGTDLLLNKNNSFNCPVKRYKRTTYFTNLEMEEISPLLHSPTLLSWKNLKKITQNNKNQ